MRFLILLPTSLLLFACASHDPFKPVAAGSLYFCEQNRQIVLSIRDNAEQAALSFEGRSMTLPRIDTRIDAKAFSDGVFTLYYNDDDIAALEKDGIPWLNACERAS